jgi:exonuclease VII large subunit
MGAKSKEGLDRYEISLMRNFGMIVSGAKDILNTLERVIAANDPARNLRLGYSIARKNGKIVKSIHSLKGGDPFDLQLADGIIEGEAKGVRG